MNDNEELDDGAVLRAVRESVSRLPMATAPGPQVITARGRARRRRRAGLSAAGAGACAALAAGLVAGSGPAGPAPQNDATRLTAFSVTSGPAGSTIVKISWKEGSDSNFPEELRQALADHGIPALITINKTCVPTMSARVPWLQSPAKSDRYTWIQIDGSKIPSGDEAYLGFHTASKKLGTVAVIGLIDANAKITCTDDSPRR